jgi:hypothetical protein
MDYAKKEQTVALLLARLCERITFVFHPAPKTAERVNLRHFI